MSEKGPCVLLEFSEEYPPIMSGYGMGTTIVNYYRKKDDKDEHVPKVSRTSGTQLITARLWSTVYPESQ
jgi:hypothetical protein